MAPTFYVTDTFSGSVRRLSKDDQTRVKVTAMNMQMDTVAYGLRLHRIGKTVDMWSARASDDLRIVVHKTDSVFALLYAGHHDDAYRWAERRRVCKHPDSQAIQIVEVQQRTEFQDPVFYAPTPVAASSAETSRPALAHIADATLRRHGVPADWVPQVKSAATDDDVLEVCEHLPAEAAEAVLEFWAGRTPAPPATLPEGADPFTHPDSKRRFFPIADSDAMALALSVTWDQWAVFLHPDQRELVERSFSGPARVTGTAGTGKTVVAVHRAVHLARRDSDAHVLLTTFSDPLANLLRSKVRLLASREPRVLERIEIVSLDSLAKKMFQAHEGTTRAANRADVQRIIESIVGPATALHSPLPFVLGEWEHVVDAWQLQDWESYRDVARLGRKTRLPEDRRMALWGVFSEVRQRLAAGGMQTLAGMYGALTGRLRSGLASPFTHAVVDEAQDISVAQLRFLSALVPAKGDSLFFAGDLGQRIFQQPFSWLSLGVDVRGRSRNLRINYRMSHQIRTKSDRLLDKESVDADGNASNRTQTISVFQGTPPRISTFASPREEAMAVTGFIRGLTSDGYEPHEIAVIVRSDDELLRATGAVADTGLEKQVLDGESEPRPGKVAVATMHLAKGLEFRAVIVMACDEDTLPLRSRIEGVGDQGDLEEVYSTERHLLYVACTRARDQLLVTGVQPASEFLDDMR